MSLRTVKLRIADIIYFSIPYLSLSLIISCTYETIFYNYLLPDLSFSRSFTADSAACVLRSNAPSREYLPAAFAMYALWSGNFPVGSYQLIILS